MNGCKSTILYVIALSNVNKQYTPRYLITVVCSDKIMHKLLLLYLNTIKTVNFNFPTDSALPYIYRLIFLYLFYSYIEK